MNPALIAVSALCVMLLAALIVTVLRRNARVKRLAENVRAYQQTGRPTPYSLKDDWLAGLQNEISGLENRLELEKQHTADARTQSAAFLSDVSHQLKTPLAGIRLYCEMLAAEDPTGYTDKELQLIEKTQRLVTELLKYQRIRADGVPFTMEDCDLSALCGGAIGELRPLFPQKRIALAGSAEARCDKQWLTQAIGNVIKNACEHTKPDGEVRVWLGSSDGVVSVAVSDDGGGVPEAQLPHLFDRFYKAANAAPTGTGLGLAITKAVIEKHRGSVSAANSEKGLTVTICLPQFDGNRKI